MDLHLGVEVLFLAYSVTFSSSSTSFLCIYSQMFPREDKLQKVVSILHKRTEYQSSGLLSNDYRVYALETALNSFLDT